MRRARPDAVYRDIGEWFPDAMLVWDADRRCPRRCEYRGEHKPGDEHVEYRKKRDWSRPVPLLGLVKR